MFKDRTILNTVVTANLILKNTAKIQTVDTTLKQTIPYNK